MDRESREPSSGAQDSDSVPEDTARDGSTPGDATTPPTAVTADDKSDRTDVWTPARAANGLKRRRETSQPAAGVRSSESHHFPARGHQACEPRAQACHVRELTSAKWEPGAVVGASRSRRLIASLTHIRTDLHWSTRHLRNARTGNPAPIETPSISSRPNILDAAPDSPPTAP